MLVGYQTIDNQLRTMLISFPTCTHGIIVNYCGSAYLDVVGDRNEDGEAAVEHQGVLAEAGAGKNKNVWSCQLYYRARLFES